MKTKTFAVGMRVKVYTGGRPPFKGTVHSYDKDAVWVGVAGCGAPDADSPFHPRQCVKLVKKVKAITLTEQRLESVLAAYWNTCLPRNYSSQLAFIKSYFKLGAVKETIIPEAP